MKIKPLKTSTGYIFFDLDGIEVIIHPIKEFIAMQKDALNPTPDISFEEQFHLREIEADLLANPRLAREKLLAKQVAQATLLARQTTIIVNHALMNGEAVKPENLEAMNLLMRVHAYCNEMVDAKSMVLAKQEETQQQLKAGMINFVQTNRLPKHVT